MKPRLAFCGLGWIGRSRLQTLCASNGIAPVAYLEPDDANRAAADAIAPAPHVDDLDALLDQRPDGVVIATPNRLHAEQARAAAEHGIPVFCQKPLAPRHAEAAKAVQAAEDHDVLLRVDWSYRGARALQAVRDALHEGSIGTCYRAELTFHNAYGPDKPWYRDPAQAGGGCLLDLGCHLFDALQWLMPEGRFHVTSSHTYAAGRPVGPGAIEDHAVVALEAEGCAAVVQSSWNVPTGGDADIRIHLFGTRGGLRFSNVGGSFYDFRADLLTGTSSRALCAPPDDWSGRQIGAWADALRDGRRAFEAEAWQVAENARLLEEAACAS